jgi:hypothetical protein
MRRFWIAIFRLYGSLSSAKLCDRVRANNQREFAGMCANLLHFANTKHIESAQYTVKKGSKVSRPQPGCTLPNCPWAGIMTS